MVNAVEQINQFFWSLTVFIIFTCAIIYLSRSLKKDEKDERILMLGFSVVSLGLAFNQFFWLLSKILLSLGTLFDIIAILNFAISMSIFFFIFDKTMKKTKYIPFFINLLLIPLIIVSFIKPLYFDNRFFVYVDYIFNATAFCLALLWFSIKSGEEFKVISIFLLTGAIVYIIGAILSSIFIKQLVSITPLISYSFLIAGAILFVTPVFLKPKEKSHVKIILILCTLIYIISLFIALYIVSLFFILYQVNFLFLISILVVIFGASLIIIHFLLSIYKFKTPSERVESDEEKDKRKDILSIFSRPETITEEEISISKEKKICLVCKKRLSRDIFLCPNCYALYCKHCSDALSNRENTCWVCNTPIDPLKPVKIQETTPVNKNDMKKMKKVAILTVVDVDFYEKIALFDWDENEKKEFIKSMLALAPDERNTIIKEMIEMAEAINKGETYFEEDF